VVSSTSQGPKNHVSRFRRAIPDTHGRALSVAGNAPTESAMFDHPHGLGVLLCPPQAKGVLADLARSWLLFRH
jgi:hypothetical protein